MTHPTDEELDALIEAVEAGNNFGIIPKAQAVLAEFDPNYGVGETVCSAFDGSLDAAKALHEALLPGWSPSVGQNVHHGYWFAHVMKAEDGAITHDCSASSETPARAWLLAVLKAYRTQVTQ